MAASFWSPRRLYPRIEELIRDFPPRRGFVGDTRHELDVAQIEGKHGNRIRSN